MQKSQVIAGVFLFCVYFGAIVSEAATLQQVGGGMQGKTKIQGSDGDGAILEESQDVQTQSIEVFSEFVGNFTSTLANTYASFNSFEQCGIWSTDFHVNVSANCYSNISGAEVNCIGALATRDADPNSGFFFEVVSTEPGEMPGDQVTIDFSWMPYITISGAGCTAKIQGLNGADHFAIALNPSQPVNGMPTAQEEIWTYSNVICTSDYNNYETGSFTARIGDIIGVFMETVVEIDYTGTEFQHLNCSSPFYFEVHIENNPADVNHDGTVNLLDFEILAGQWTWTRPGRIMD